MQVLFPDPFDHWLKASGAGLYTATSMNFGNGPQAGKGRNGTSGFVLDVNDYLMQVFSTSYAVYEIHLAVYFTGITGGRLVSAYDGTTLQWYLANLSNSNKLSLHRGDGTQLAVMTDPLPQNVYHQFSLKVGISNSTGISRLNVNKQSLSEFTKNTLDTQMSANATADTIKIERTGTGSVVWLDDLVIRGGSAGDSDPLLGDLHLFALPPTGDGPTNQGTPSTGSSHYQMVDEDTPDGLSTYITLDNGNIELFTCEDLPATGTIPFVTAHRYRNKSDSGDVQDQGILRPASTNHLGTQVTMSTDFSWAKDDIYETDPDDLAAWTKAKVDGCRVGVKRAV